MAYIHGQNKCVCDFCDRKIEISMFSSRPLYDIKEQGWDYWVEEIIHNIPEKIVESKYQGRRTIKAYKKTEKIIKVKCDSCIIVGERVKKIKKIKDKLNG